MSVISRNLSKVSPEQSIPDSEVFFLLTEFVLTLSKAGVGRRGGGSLLAAEISSGILIELKTSQSR